MYANGSPVGGMRIRRPADTPFRVGIRPSPWVKGGAGIRPCPTGPLKAGWNADH
jgi:hypothetical protein